MTKIRVKPLKDTKTKVAINSGWHRIEEIKEEIATINVQKELCQAEVVEMWNSSSETN